MPQHAFRDQCATCLSQFPPASCILHPPASREWNSGFQIWWKAPFSTESSLSPLTSLLSWYLGLLMQSNALAPGVSGTCHHLPITEGRDSGPSVICSSVEEVTWLLYSFRRKGSTLDTEA